MGYSQPHPTIRNSFHSTKRSQLASWLRAEDSRREDWTGVSLLFDRNLCLLQLIHLLPNHVHLIQLLRNWDIGDWLTTFIERRAKAAVCNGAHGHAIDGMTSNRPWTQHMKGVGEDG